MTTSTSDDEKSVSPMCSSKVEGALARAESPSGAINEGDAGLLAAEVRRSHERERALDREWGARYERISAKLARVEALARSLGGFREKVIMDALRDQQPSAAPTPTNKGEPYNGY